MYAVSAAATQNVAMPQRQCHSSRQLVQSSTAVPPQVPYPICDLQFPRTCPALPSDAIKPKPIRPVQSAFTVLASPFNCSLKEGSERAPSAFSKISKRFQLSPGLDQLTVRLKYEPDERYMMSFAPAAFGFVPGVATMPLLPAHSNRMTPAKTIKRKRSLACEVIRKFRCDFPNCDKAYGSVRAIWKIIIWLLLLTAIV
jgi:hypothetical protein